MRLFVDSGPFIALLDSGDGLHEEAARFMGECVAGKSPYRRLFASNYVLNEVMTHVLYRRRSHPEVMRALDLVGGSKYISLLHVTPEVHEKALGLFRRTRHPLLSFTDCTTVALMEAHGIEAVFSFDRDFGKLGFKVVP